MNDAAINDMKVIFLDKVAKARTTAELDAVRVEALGKNGAVTLALKDLAHVGAGERKDKGFKLNQVKVALTSALDERKTSLARAEMEAGLHADALDVTLPVRPASLHQGRIHPLYKVTEELTAIFASLGFTIKEGPDLEDDFHNFTALNTPLHHPARQMQDSFFVDQQDQDGNYYVLRTQTSAVQIRTMEQQKPPIRIICPGRTYRKESDATHSAMFHQVEGLVIDRTTNMSHLKGCLVQFITQFFEVTEGEVELRFRSSFFPFTEPSIEVDMGYSRTGNGIKIGGHERWLELGGAGMVHPNVLRAGGINPDEYQGFAFGIGLDRLTMLKYGIPDIRQFFAADPRWLSHYGFVPFDIPGLIEGLTANGGERL